MFDALAGADIPEMAGVPGSCGLPRPEKELPDAPTGAPGQTLNIGEPWRSSGLPRLGSLVESRAVGDVALAELD